MVGESLLDATQRYLASLLDLSIKITPRSSTNLPPYLRERYHLSSCTLLAHTFLLVAQGHEDPPLPARIAKDFEHLRQSGQEPVYLRQALSSDKRRRLMQHRIPFIIPGNQLYLPPLGLDLREHFLRERNRPIMVSPATQVLLLEQILRPGAPLSPSVCASRLGYSPMTMTRAFDEIETLGLASPGKPGRQRHLFLIEKGHALWARALPHLASPVKQHLWVTSSFPLALSFTAGISALSERSNLQAGPHETRALSARSWNRKAQAAYEADPETAGALEIELWGYEPGLLGIKGDIDPLSLFLSLRHIKDERLESALEELLAQELKW